ncbi:NUDIX domain-containing protein [Candidatus Nanohalovita haloferacivicina]|uniref:NUDIX domain-containing protein n=1 Tax=Candidatus Nanohalovita haloferacivicina TaxID=2978046 RepID=UPI00325FB691|nr:hypothetical protein HBNXNv_0628 [Candidatus Nanohalobia archaeon BNXNv]
MIEYVPVVDEDDEWMYNARRELVHDEENPAWHRSVTVLTFRTDEQEELLVQRRSEDKERKPGLLEFTGGHVLSGESYREAAIREYCEELMDREPEQTSIEDDDFEELTNVDKKSPDNWEKVSVYHTIYDGPLDLSEEVDSAWYAPVDEVVEDIEDNPEMYTNSAVESLKAYLESSEGSDSEEIRI